MSGLRRSIRGLRISQALTLAGLAWATGLGASPLTPRPGSPLWLKAEMLSWELPGARLPLEEERALLAATLAAPGLEAAAAALEEGRSPAPPLATALEGEAGALSRRDAVAQLVGLRAPGAGAGDLPVPVEGKTSRAFAEAEARRAEEALAGGLDAGTLQRWIRAVAARGEAAAAGAGLPVAVQQVAPAEILVRALDGDEDARLAAWRGFRALAWARRAVRSGLLARVDAAYRQVDAAMKAATVPVKVRVRSGAGETSEGLVVSLAGGRLGTSSTDDEGRALLAPKLGDLARVARGEGVVALQVVQQRREVLRRELPVELFLAAGEALDLGDLVLPPGRGRLLVEVPGWQRLLAGQVEGAAPVKATVRVGGAMRPESLGRDGRAVVPALVPGLHLVSLAGQDDSGTVVQRAFGAVEVPPGEDAVCTLRLPIEEVPEPTKRTRVADVRKDLADLAARYKAGRIPRGSFRRAVGSIYRIHREVTGDPKKDEAFSSEVRVAMQAAFQSVLPDAVAGGDPGPALGALEREFTELAALLPEFLRGDRPAGRLDEYLQVEIGGAFAVDESGYRSIRHRRADLRRARAAAEEVGGIQQLVTAVVAPRLAESTATLRKQAEAYRDGYTHFHLAGLDYEERFLRLAADNLAPLRELVRRARQLEREKAVEDLRSRVEAEEEAVEAAAVGLEVQGRRWEAVRERLEVLRGRLSRMALRPPELPFGIAPLVARAEKEELSGAAVLRDLEVEGAPEAGLARAGEMVAGRQEVARLWARAHMLREVLDGRIRAGLVRAWERRADPEALDELARMAPADRTKALAQHTEGLYETQAAAPLEVPSWVPGVAPAGTRLAAAVRAWDADRVAQEEYLRLRGAELEVLEAREPGPTLEDLEAWGAQAKQEAPAVTWVPGGLGPPLVERWEALVAAARARASEAASPASTGAPSN